MLWLGQERKYLRPFVSKKKVGFFRHSTALAVVFADKTMFQHINDHFQESLFGEFATIQQNKRKEEKNKDQQKAKVRKREKQRRIPKAKWEGQLLTSTSITDAHSSSSMSRWTTDWYPIRRKLRKDSGRKTLGRSRWKQRSDARTQYMRSLLRQNIRRRLCHPDMRRLLLGHGELGGFRSATVLAASTTKKISTYAQIEEKPKKQHNQKTRRGERNKKHAQERLVEKNPHRKQNRKMQTDKTRRCNSSAQSGCERTYSNSKPGNRYNQENTKPKFPKPTLREGSFQDLFKQMLASKTKLVKQYITHRNQYSRNRSTRFCQILIKKGSQYPKYVAKASTLTLPVCWSMARNSRSLRWI